MSNSDDPFFIRDPFSNERIKLIEKYKDIIAQMFRAGDDRDADPKEIPWEDERFRRLFYDRAVRLKEQADMWCKTHAVIQALMSK